MSELKEKEEIVLDFLGEWKLTDTHFASVLGKLCGYWFGWIYIGTLEIPSLWDSKGNSANPLFNLKERRRGQEKWPKK